MTDELEKLKPPTGYAPAPLKSAGFDDRLLMVGGTNPLGEPFLKVSWGWDLRTFRNGNPDALRYPGPFLSRWILEQWMPPEIFGKPEDWEKARYLKTGDGKTIDSLGPYPRQGMYGMVMPIIAGGVHGTKAGDYMPCDDALMECIEINMPMLRGNIPNAYKSPESYAALQEQMAAEEQSRFDEVDEWAHGYYDEIRSREEQINRNPDFSFSKHLVASRNLWTPDGEIPIQ
jgi:hypothetical protein